VDFYLYNDKDTYTVKNIPQNNKGGLFVAGDGAQLGDCTIDSDYQISCNGLTNRK
jgi:hypothetical protein